MLYFLIRKACHLVLWSLQPYVDFAKKADVTHHAIICMELFSSVAMTQEGRVPPKLKWLSFWCHMYSVFVNEAFDASRCKWLYTPMSFTQHPVKVFWYISVFHAFKHKLMCAMILKMSLLWQFFTPMTMSHVSFLHSIIHSYCMSFCKLNKLIPHLMEPLFHTGNLSCPAYILDLSICLQIL